MALTLEEFVGHFGSLVKEIIVLIRDIAETVLHDVSAEGGKILIDFVVKLVDVVVGAIHPLIDWVVKIGIGAGEMVTTNETVNEAWHNVTGTVGGNVTEILGPQNASYGITYLLSGIRGTDPAIAGEILSELLNTISSVIEIIIDLLISFGG
jgi:hypothetical protein